MQETHQGLFFLYINATFATLRVNCLIYWK